jgi:hypothetical protein
VKTGVFFDEAWDRIPLPFELHQDPDLVNTSEDPIKYLIVRNSVFNPALDRDRKPWRGPREKSDIFFQILIEACSMPGSIVADLSASTKASLKACRASSRHFLVWSPIKTFMRAC